MIKKISALIVCISVFLCLSGCDLMPADTAELLSPPALSGDLKPIDDIIKQTAGESYTLKYPSRGDFRSAIIREDINGDGSLEAFAFYYTTDGETGSMNITAIAKKKDTWKSVASQKIVAGGVDKVDFCDLDDDGIKEILVGWEIYGTSEMQLAVYSLDEKNLVQKMLQRYTHFDDCDLDQNGKNEILIIKSATLEQTNSAALFEISKNGVTQISACELDSTSKTINEPVFAPLSNGTPAVYIDEIKGVGAVTEVLYFEKGELKNPLFSTETKETFATLRPVSLSLRDINGDGIPEIPVQENVPSVTSGELNEILYLTNWCSFNGKTLTIQKTAMVNVNDGFSFAIPVRLIGKIAVLKDTDNHLREIYLYDKIEKTVGKRIVSFKVFSLSDWKKKRESRSNAEVILKTETQVFVCYLYEAAKNYDLTIETVKSNFSLF